MTTGDDPAMAYLDARDRLLTSLHQRLSRMCNAELERLNESLASQGLRDNAEQASSTRRPDSARSRIRHGGSSRWPR